MFNYCTKDTELTTELKKAYTLNKTQTVKILIMNYYFIWPIEFALSETKFLYP